MSEIIADPQLRNFVHSNVSDDFGLTVDQVAEGCKNDGRFRVWLNSDITRIKEVLNVVKANGVSPAFFASYERTEGYNSSWGWLNHTSVNGTPVSDADSVSKWVALQSMNTTDKPAWIDFANYKDFVPESVKQQGNSDFATMTPGSIGKVVIAGTSAGAWEVYYPLGLLKEYNGVQNYGKPITNMLTYIQSWGGTVDGSVGSKPAFPTWEGAPINSPYGWRLHPIENIMKFHAGTDFGTNGNDPPIYATQSGVVVDSRFMGGGGNGIVIKHSGDPYFSRYFHMKYPSLLSEGDIVNKGQEIGVMGTTGDSTGIHLHFEVALTREGLGTENSIDPEIYLQMTFGGGSGDGGKPLQNTLIELWLCDALHGWKY